MNPYREPSSPTSRLREFFVNRVTRPTVVLAAILIAGLAIAAATPSLRLNGIRYPDGTGSPSGVFNVKAPEWGAIGDGSTDDTAAIQAAVTAAAVKGGTVFFPSSNGERYKITSTITVSSIYPVNLVGQMYSYADNQTTGSFIKPGANFGSTSMFQYVAPTPHSAQHGAGRIEGLVFYDNTNTNHTVNFTMLAALDLYDFNRGTVSNCKFFVLNGGAIRAISMVKGDIGEVTIEFAGTAGQPALSLESLSGNNVVQSTAIHDFRMEYDYGKYISLNSATSEVKITNGGFEADTATASTDNNFIDNSGQETFISNVHMNRNTATQLVFESASNFGFISGLYVGENSSKTGNASVVINGANHSISNLSISGATAQTTAALSITGAYSVFNGIQVINSGGIAVTGNLYDTLSNVYIASMVSGSGTYAIDITGGAFDTKVTNAVVRLLPNNTGGIRVTGTAGSASIQNCDVHDAAGTGIGFRDENASNLTSWIGNQSVSNATAFSATAASYVARGNSWGGVETETITPPTTFSSTLTGNSTVNFGASSTVTFNNGLFLGSGKVADCSGCTLNLGVTSSTSTSISKTGTTMTVNGSLRGNQGVALHYRSAATTVTVATTDYYVGVTGTGSRTVNLPAANTCLVAGQVFVIQEIGNDVGTITINRASTDLINGATTTTIAAAFGSKTLTCDGSANWYVR